MVSSDLRGRGIAVACDVVGLLVFGKVSAGVFMVIDDGGSLFGCVVVRVAATTEDVHMSYELVS